MGCMDVCWSRGIREQSTSTLYCWTSPLNLFLKCSHCGFSGEESLSPIYMTNLSKYLCIYVYIPIYLSGYISLHSSIYLSLRHLFSPMCKSNSYFSTHKIYSIFILIFPTPATSVNLSCASFTLSGYSLTFLSLSIRCCLPVS